MVRWRDRATSRKGFSRLLAYQSKKKKKEAYRPCRRLLAYQSKKKKKERSISAMPECYENRASGGRGPAKLPSVSADAWCVGEIWYARRLLAYQSKKKKKKESYRPCRNATKTGQVAE